MKKKDTFKYKLKNGRKTVYYGITNNTRRREAEHRNTKIFGKLVKIGKACTKASAKAWERNILKKYRSYHKGKNPKYNKTKTG
jgi:hypothetical protein